MKDNVMKNQKKFVEKSYIIKLSEKDTLTFLDALENPSPPTKKALAAAHAFANRTQKV